MIKLLALDIDDTIAQPDGTIRRSTIAAIQQAHEHGITIALVSARPPQGIHAVAQLIQAPVYRIAYLGAVIQLPDQTEILRLSIDLPLASDIARFADAHRIALTLSIADREYQTQNVARPSMTPRVVIASAAQALEPGIAPVIIAVTEDSPSRLVYDYCMQQYPDRVHIVRHVNSAGSNLSALIVHPEAEKGKSLLKLCHALSIPAGDVMAVGDSESDLTMFRVSGFSAAVQNASSTVAKAATAVAPFPYGEGVQWVIENMVLPK